MSPEQRILKECLARLDTDPAGAMNYFYGRLFTAEPRLRALFPPAMGHQHDRFFGALTRLVSGQDHPEELAAHLERLGRGHRKYGVLPEHYPAVEAALTATLRAFAAGVWTPEAEDAWRTAYRSAADTMIRAAERDAEDAPPWWVAEVVEHDRRAPDLAVLTLRPERPVPFAAGQHVPVQTARWPRVWRPYSIANAPRPDGLVRLHVRARPAGWVSGALVRHTGPGDTLLLGPPDGGMTLDPGSDRPLLLAGGGTGLAPMKALAEQAIASGRDCDVHLLVAARHATGLYDLPELRLLESHHPRLRVVPVLSRGTAADDLSGRVPDVLPRLLEGVSGRDEHEAYVAGPVPMVRETVTALQRLGVPLARIRHDLLAAGG
ncbi:globin domain-containing protein [Actinomadura madurae]|uniref:globin domain-containing protein n=1 Tax=Actinomadura madurae TaxID=1993 RepID=UPI002025FF9A|nr:globin domain-containing protein [Actinomadura madurae]MCP9964174.1 globin domain-containing protein [Actinomadura madurae]URN03804.1 globin domain-containing protein [Actinomadura madurae]